MAQVTSQASSPAWHLGHAAAPRNVRPKSTTRRARRLRFATATFLLVGDALAEFRPNLARRCLDLARLTDGEAAGECGRLRGVINRVGIEFCIAYRHGKALPSCGRA